MRTITLEEHFATPRFLDGPARYVVLPGGRRINVPASLSQPASPAGPPHSGAILSDPRMAHHVG
jgi:hypothetical protein